jgi:hypothetical protein
MRGIRHSLLAACCCGLILVPAVALGDDWPENQPDWESPDLSAVRGTFDRESNHDPYPVTFEDLGDLSSPFDSQFPDLPLEINPFYRGVETDRAAYTPAISTAPIGTMIVEAGYSFIANRHLPSEHSYPELMLRFGLSERIELRFGWNEQLGGGSSVVSPIQVQEGLVLAPKNPFNPISYQNGFLFGAKARLICQDGWIPSNTVIVQGYKPSLGDTRKAQVQATYALGWELAPRWRFDMAVRYATESEIRDDWATWSPSVVFRAPFAERWSADVEYFGIVPRGQSGGMSQHFAGPGIQFLVTPDAQINLRVGTGLTSQSPEFYMSVGMGVAF